MGTDDLFRKRKAKSASALSRRSGSRRSYDRVLIVCEGSKTEPNYFSEIKDHYELSSANIHISGDCGSDPSSVLKHGISLFREAKISGNPYDRVYFVFDRDGHEKYQQVCNEIASKNPKDTFYAAVSVPCFEYWLLLHFKMTTAPITAAGKKSSCDRTISLLRENDWNAYSKGEKGVFIRLLPKLEKAITNAKLILTESRKSGNDNPSTRVHELVAYLQDLKSEHPA